MSKRKSDLTEEDRIKRLIICRLCHETLEDPILLPCGKTICSEHLLKKMKQTTLNVIYATILMIKQLTNFQPMKN